jgi:putative colanic acid biosynthesis glycosyltransferase WcaI
MKIFLYGLNFSPELTGIGKFSGEMAKHLCRSGHDVHAVTTPPYYPEWKIHSGFSAWRYTKSVEAGVIIYRTPTFVPRNPNTFKRILHLLSYAISSMPVAFLHLPWKPDIVMTVQPTLFASAAALLLAKLTGAKAILHIQDYELDALIGLGLMKSGVFTRSVTFIERWLMARFDAISTISSRMIESAKKKGVPASKLILFPNWADIGLISPDVDGSQVKTAWGFSEEQKIVLYSGNIGVKQGLEMILDAAEKFRLNSAYQFLVVGAGACSDALKADARLRGLKNIHFKSLQPVSLLPSMLAMADVHLVLQKRGVADVVMPSKVANILCAGGHALVTAEKSSELGLLEAQFPGIFTRIEPENPDVFIGALNNLLRSDLDQPNRIAREYALEFQARDKILSRFEQDLLSLMG